jgi:hypothetical protein
MMTTKIGAAIAAGFLATGILVGAAGTIVIREATASDHMADMAGMSAMGSMMSMMGAGSPMGPNASMTPDQHASHHATPSPEATR